MATSTKRPSPYGPRKFASIDDYHSSFEEDVRKILDQMRAAIRQAAPKATEVISYNMPAFKGNKNLVYYAANKEHLGFYPTPLPEDIFGKDLEGYQRSKGAIQFPYSKPFPVALVKKIVSYRVKVDAAATEVKPAKSVSKSAKRKTATKKKTAVKSKSRR
ncbi:MAG: DUF1801 domain-containing protein [Chitinophagaceae bacterium]|nr:DUF1801 domain-containing protein [Chitinophagaceae bacterium]